MFLKVLLYLCQFNKMLYCDQKSHARYDFVVPRQDGCVLLLALLFCLNDDVNRY